MNFKRSVLFKLAGAGVVAVGALFAAASADAGPSWSLGIAVPGVEIGVVEPAPAYYDAPPVYYQPAPPVYYRPPPPAYYRPAPAYYGPSPPVYYERGDRWREHHHRRDWDNRGDRD